MSIWTWEWIIWIASGLIVEAVAIFNDRRDDTLSEHFRKWWHTDTHLGRSLWLFAWGGFSVWFLIHIAFKGIAG